MPSDNEPEKPKPIEHKQRFKIDLAKLSSWMDQHSISSKCPFCESTSWTVPQNDSIVGNAFPWGDGWGDMFMTGMPVISMVCNKCYFVRTMALDRGLREIVAGDIENDPQQ
jgi:hypothetical protein